MWAVGTPSQVSTYTKPKSLSSWLIASSVSVSWGLILRDCSEAFESSLRNWRVMFKIYKQIYETYISPWPGWQNLELYCTKALALQVQDHLGHGVSGRETSNKGRTGSLEPREYKNFIKKISPQTRNGAEIYMCVICAVILNTKKLYFVTIFYRVPPFATQILTRSPP